MVRWDVITGYCGSRKWVGGRRTGERREQEPPFRIKDVGPVVRARTRSKGRERQGMTYVQAGLGKAAC